MGKVVSGQVAVGNVLWMLFPGRCSKFSEPGGELDRQHTLANNTHVNSMIVQLYSNIARRLSQRLCRLQPTPAQGNNSSYISAHVARAVYTWSAAVFFLCVCFSLPHLPIPRKVARWPLAQWVFLHVNWLDRNNFCTFQFCCVCINSFANKFYKKKHLARQRHVTLLSKLQTDIELQKAYY
jgi:hypothetical protein